MTADPYIELADLSSDGQVVAHTAFCIKCGLGLGSYYDPEDLAAVVADHESTSLHAAGPAVEGEG